MTGAETLREGAVESRDVAVREGGESRPSIAGDYSRIRYGQCWEDADVLLEALAIRPGDRCFSIASGGDNALAMLAGAPSEVVAIDMNPAQLACLELRVAAYKTLEHRELLELVGSRAGDCRPQLYGRCRGLLSPAVRRFWDGRPGDIEKGIGHAGQFERYFETFRRRILPWIHPPDRQTRLLRGGSPDECREFYDTVWNTWRWNLMFRIFFSRRIMARSGRDPGFFKYATGSPSRRLLARAAQALTTLNPAENPYLHWIMRGRHEAALPFALRPENFERIRDHIDRLHWRCCSLDEFLDDDANGSFERFNLSDVFEYVPVKGFHRLLRATVRRAVPGARLAYWNTLVDRRRPESMAGELRSLDALSRALHTRDKAFFYSAFIVEEVV